MVDRTTKVLLLLIAIALWGLLLRPVLAPGPIRAEETAAGENSEAAAEKPMPVNIVQVNGKQLLANKGGMPIEGIVSVNIVASGGELVNDDRGIRIQGSYKGYPVEVEGSISNNPIPVRIER